MTGFQNQENEGQNTSFGGDRGGQANSLIGLGSAYESLGLIQYNQEL